MKSPLIVIGLVAGITFAMAGCPQNNGAGNGPLDLLAEEDFAAGDLAVDAQPARDLRAAIIDAAIVDHAIVDSAPGPVLDDLLAQDFSTPADLSHDLALPDLSIADLVDLAALDLSAPSDLLGADFGPCGMCPAATPVCNPATNKCVECLDATSCHGGAQPACCGNACVDLASDVSNCGQCQNSCPQRPHSSRRCLSTGACDIALCDNGWSNCNGIPADGCEADVESDANNCGACNAICDTSSGMACQSGSCQCIDPDDPICCCC